MTELLSTLIGALAALGGVWLTVRAQRDREAADREAERAREGAAHQAAMICDVQVACQLMVRAAVQIAYATAEENLDADLLAGYGVVELAKARITDEELLRRTDRLSALSATLAMPAIAGQPVAETVGELLEASRAHSDRVRELLVTLPPPGHAAGSLFDSLR